ncbi:MAG: GNAT family N-acetyltransferase [Anaerolineales bacterium]
MPDILVKLYALDDDAPDVPGVTLRHPLPHEKTVIGEWIARHFHRGWADEFEVSYKTAPPSSFIAVRGDELVGFACYDVTTRGFFGPTGVLEGERGRGIGVALLKRSLFALRALGYAYAIIGDAGPVEFYVKAVGGIPIPDSDTGIYPAPIHSDHLVF